MPVQTRQRDRKRVGRSVLRAKAARRRRRPAIVGNRAEVMPSNPLKADPTRSVTLRRIFVADFWKRFEALKGKVLRLIVEEDAFGIKQTRNESDGPTANARRWEFRSDPEKVKAFGRWLEGEIQGDIITVTDAKRADAYWTKYVEQGYRKGQGRAFDDTRHAAGLTGTKDDFLRSSFGRPVAVNKVKLLAGRVFTDLRGVTSAMETQMTRILADGLSQGQNPRVIAQAMNDRIAKIGQNRSRLIAQTELIRAHSEGQLDAFESLGVTEVGVMAELSTAGDDRVCDRCSPLEGVVMTIREARGLIPRHPGCRCVWLASNVGEPTAGQQRGKAAISRARDRSVRAEIPKTSKRTLAQQKDVSRWAGADKAIAKRRPKSVLEASP